MNQSIRFQSYAWVDWVDWEILVACSTRSAWVVVLVVWPTPWGVDSVAALGDGTSLMDGFRGWIFFMQRALIKDWYLLSEKKLDIKSASRQREMLKIDQPPLCHSVQRKKMERRWRVGEVDAGSFLHPLSQLAAAKS